MCPGSFSPVALDILIGSFVGDRGQNLLYWGYLDSVLGMMDVRWSPSPRSKAVRIVINGRQRQKAYCVLGWGWPLGSGANGHRASFWGDGNVP